jgi:uncharacterized protein (TIGR03000 family)
MYSVVLMMALSGGAEVPDRGGCHGCHGCRGGCYGGGCHGCYGGGGCYGCWGGGYGGCCGGGCYGGGCYGCWGGGYGGCCGGGYAMSSGCYGCYGGMTMSYGGMPYGYAQTTYYAPAVATTTTIPTVEPTKATIVVSLPADATLTVDDNPTTSTSATRVFASPPLQPGKQYTYTLKAEIVRDGQKVVAEKKVPVRAGQESRVTLDFPARSVASR